MAATTQPVQAAVQAICVNVLNMSAPNGDTMVTVARHLVNDLARTAHFDASTAAGLAQLLREFPRTATPSVSVLCVGDNGGTLVFSVQVPNARAAELLVFDAFASPCFSVELKLVTPQAILAQEDADIVATEAANHGVLAVTIVSVEQGFSRERERKIHSLLQQRYSVHKDDLPPCVPLARLNTIAPEQKQILIIDRAHLLGSVQWATVVRNSSRTLIVVGCPLLRSVSPGLTLSDLFCQTPLSEPFLGVAAMRFLAVTELLPMWLLRARADCVSLDSLFAALPDNSACVLMSPPKTVTPALQEAHRRYMTTTSVRLAALPSVSDVAGPTGQRPLLVLFEAALYKLRLSEWLFLLVHGWDSAVVIRRPIAAQNTPVPYEQLIRTCKAAPRHLAAHVLLPSLRNPKKV